MNSRKYICIGFGLALFVSLFIFIKAVPAHAEYSGSRLIDNKVFLDAKSMTKGSIQTFLENKGSGLATKKYELQCYDADSKERAWYEAAGATCDEQVFASEIIYYAAQIYGVSPRVILATLQKEQNLVTSGNPTSWQLDQAMGYACPTSGGCSNSTFPYQIDSGTWALRYHYERANKNYDWWTPSEDNYWVCGSSKNYYKPSLYPGQNVRFHDGDDVHYRTYNLNNAATSAMYCYTPHAFNNFPGCKTAYGVSYASWKPTIGSKGMCYSGSYNFVIAFENWFGSTQHITNYRLISCSDIKYLIERYRPIKRELTDTSIREWGLTEALFQPEDKGCEYPTYDIELDVVIQSRSSSRKYFLNKEKFYRIQSISIARSWKIDTAYSGTAPMLDGATIHDLDIETKLPRLAKSSNTGKVYLMDRGKLHHVLGTPSNTKILKLVRGYEEIPMATISADYLVELKALYGEGLGINGSFKVGSQWYLFDHARTRAINPAYITGRWSQLNGLLAGPDLSPDVPNAVGVFRSFTKGFRRDGIYYVVREGGIIDNTTSRGKAEFWEVTHEPQITHALKTILFETQ